MPSNNETQGGAEQPPAEQSTMAATADASSGIPQMNADFTRAAADPLAGQITTFAPAASAGPGNGHCVNAGGKKHQDPPLTVTGFTGFQPRNIKINLSDGCSVLTGKFNQSVVGFNARFGAPLFGPRGPGLYGNVSYTKGKTWPSDRNISITAPKDSPYDPKTATDLGASYFNKSALTLGGELKIPLPEDRTNQFYVSLGAELTRENQWMEGLPSTSLYDALDGTTGTENLAVAGFLGTGYYNKSHKFGVDVKMSKQRSQKAPESIDNQAMPNMIPNLYSAEVNGATISAGVYKDVTLGRNKMGKEKPLGLRIGVAGAYVPGTTYYKTNGAGETLNEFKNSGLSGQVSFGITLK